MARLEIQWQTTDAKFYYNLSACLLFIGGFSASLLLAAPAVPACFLACSLAISMFIATDLFGSYKEKQFMAASNITPLDNNESIEQSRVKLMTALAKNTLAPAILMATYAASLPAALLLTAMYTAYELSCRYLSNDNSRDDDSNLPSPKQAPNL
jgi:hypothetical protein